MIGMKELNKFCMNAMTKTLRKVAPALALKYAKNVLFTPKRAPSKWPNHVKQFNSPTRYGDVCTYKYGSGKSKCIWLIHGWSGSAFDFWPLMQKLAEKGYSTITFDFPSHGQNIGKSTSLPQMIKVFEDVSASLLEPHLVITHGMGASVVANSCWLKSYQSDLLLISPILDTYKLLQNLVSKADFDQQLFDRAIAELNKREKIDISRLNAIPALSQFAGVLKVMHDKHDALAPLMMSKQLSKDSNATLITTNKLGHNKILRSRSLLNTVESYIPKPLQGV